MVVGGEDAMVDFGALRRRTFALLRGGVRGGVLAIWWFDSMRVCVWAREKIANRGVFNFSCRFAKIVLNLRRVFRREVQQDGYDA